MKRVVGLGLASLAGCLMAACAAAPPPADSTPTRRREPAVDESGPPESEQAPPPGDACRDPGERDFAGEFDQAEPIEATSTTIGCGARGDVDMFTVILPEEAPGGALVRFRVRGARELAPILEVYDGDRRKQHRQQGGTGEQITGWFLAAAESTVYVRVAQVHGVDESYTLILETTALGDAGEPNNQADGATPLAEAGSAQGFMAAAINDADALSDWYRIDVGRPGTLKIDIDMSESIAARAELLDGRRRRIARTSGGRSERLALEARVQRGTHYLSLESVHRVDAAGSGAVPAFLRRPYVLTTSR